MKKNANVRQAVFVSLILFFGALSWSPTHAQSDGNWTRFRGPNGSGVVASAKLPTKWEVSDSLWQIKLAGSGTSSPVVWGNRLFVTSCDAQTAELSLECFDCGTGKKIWDQSFDSSRYRLHSWNSFASSTPAVDDEHVYITYANPDHTYLVALDHDGKEIWRRDFGKWVSAHGFGCSPIVVDDKVVFCNSQQGVRLRGGQQPGKSELVAVHRKTGKDAWRTPLTSTHACYAVPCVIKSGDKSLLIGCSNAEGFYSVDPDSGELKESEQVFRMRTVASTVVFEDMVFGSNGSGGGGNYLVAHKLVGDGFEKAYEVNRNANYVSTPIVVDGMLFLFGDKGIGTCVDAKSGEVHWRKRMSRGFTGSPVATSDHLYVMDSAGKVIVLEASSEFKLVSEIDLGEATRATPAISGNRIFFRTQTQLFAVGAKE